MPHGDDDVAGLLLRLDVLGGLDDLLEVVGPVDDRAVATLLDERLQQLDVPPRIEVSVEGQRQEGVLPEEPQVRDAEPSPVGERATATSERVVPYRVEDDVIGSPFFVKSSLV